MPAVPADIREKLKKKLDKALDGTPGDPTKKVTIKGFAGTQPKEVTVADGFCLVILTKKAAKLNELSPCNNDEDLCIWDPVTGDIRCTGDN